MHIRISLSTKFQVNPWIASLALRFFVPNLPKKGISGWKQKKINNTTELCIFELVSVPNFRLTHELPVLPLDFLYQICPKRVFPVEKKKKNEQHHWMVHIRISLSTKFQVNPLSASVALIYYMRAALALNGLKWLFWFLDQIYSNRIFPVKNRNSEHHH